MDLRKAISPILATVILIAVTLVIAIGVIGWIMGVWGSIGGPTESLVVTGGGTAIGKIGGWLNFTLTINNKGTAPATLSRIEVVGLGSTSDKCNISASKENQQKCSGCTIPAGKTAFINASVSASASFTCVVGTTYNVNVYTQAGNVYSTVIRIINCSSS